MTAPKTQRARHGGVLALVAPVGLLDRQRKAAANSRATAARRSSSSKPRTVKTMPMPASGVSDNVLSFQYGLSARDHAAVARALQIVGGELRRADVMNSSSMAKQYINLQLAGERCEKFAVLHLDSQNRALAFDIMFSGTLTQAAVYPREVVLAALAHGSRAVVLAHNHPSGNVQPSTADHHLTARLKAALALVEIEVLDHIIVSPGAALSMAERGLL